MASKKPAKKSEKKHTAVPPVAARPVVEKTIETPKVAATPVAATTPTAAVAKPVAAAAKPAVETKTAPSAEVLAKVAELSADDSNVRTSAAAALGKLGDRFAVPALIVGVRDSSAEAASESAASLGLLGDKSAVEPLINVINNVDGFFHSVVRAAAAQSLGQLKDTRATQPLLEMVNDPMAEASAEAVRALANIGDAAAINPLIEVVRNSNGFYLQIVRRAAVLALAKLGGPVATEALKNVAADQYEDNIIREAASGVAV